MSAYDPRKIQRLKYLNDIQAIPASGASVVFVGDQSGIQDVVSGLLETEVSLDQTLLDSDYAAHVDGEGSVTLQPGNYQIFISARLGTVGEPVGTFGAQLWKGGSFHRSDSKPSSSDDATLCQLNSFEVISSATEYEFLIGNVTGSNPGLTKGQMVIVRYP